MARGGNHMTRVHYKGRHDDYFVFLDSTDDYRRWLHDSSIPLAQVVRSFQVFCTHKYVTSAAFYDYLAAIRSLTYRCTFSRHGNQGMYDAASNADLDNEFGTHVDVEVMQRIMRDGSIIEGRVSLNSP
jgi:hypothetical protein